MKAKMTDRELKYYMYVPDYLKECEPQVNGFIENYLNEEVPEGAVEKIAIALGERLGIRILTEAHQKDSGDISIVSDFRSISEMVKDGWNMLLVKGELAYLAAQYPVAIGELIAEEWDGSDYFKVHFTQLNDFEVLIQVVSRRDTIGRKASLMMYYLQNGQDRMAFIGDLSDMVSDDSRSFKINLKVMPVDFATINKSDRPKMFVRMRG